MRPSSRFSSRAGAFRACCDKSLPPSLRPRAKRGGKQSRLFLLLIAAFANSGGILSGLPRRCAPRNDGLSVFQRPVRAFCDESMPPSLRPRAKRGGKQSRLFFLLFAAFASSGGILSGLPRRCAPRNDGLGVFQQPARAFCDESMPPDLIRGGHRFRVRNCVTINRERAFQAARSLPEMLWSMMCSHRAESMLPCFSFRMLFAINQCPSPPSRGQAFIATCHNTNLH